MKHAIVILCSTLFVCNANALSWRCCYGGREYTAATWGIGGNGAALDGYGRAAIPTATKGAVTIPSKYGSPSIGDGTIRYVGNSSFYNCTNLTSITIPKTVTDIEANAFKNATSLKSIIFEGNAPDLWTGAMSGISSSAIIYVYPSSKNWGVTIPGKWNGVTIRYMKSISFDANGGSASVSTIWRSDDLPVGTLPTPTRTGYTLNGWYTAKSGGSKISASTTVSANTTYYAQWTINQYTVTFDANGGTGGTSQKMAYSATITPPSVTRTGFTFAGWSSAVAATVPANDVIYTAQWTVNEYTITFNANDGSDTTSRTIEYGSSLGTLPTPTRVNHFFKGWFTEQEGGDQITSTTTVSGTKTYYAQWEYDQIPELVDGLTISEALDGAADSKLPTKVNSTRKYSYFRGWVDDNALVHKTVKESPNAWLAYVLDAPGLVAKERAVASDDFRFTWGGNLFDTAGRMAFNFSVDGGEIGDEAELEEAFAIEGATTLEESAFTESGLTSTMALDGEGGANVIVTPPKDSSGNPPSQFFMRLKVK